MDVFEAIERRRSIRAFKDTPVPRETVQRVLEAARLAPSGKNRQPWEFVVITESAKPAMLEIMDKGLEECGEDERKWARFSRDIMASAPVTVFVFNPSGEYPWNEILTGQRFQELVDVQSIGAAIENMILAATALGLGSLWVCDVFSAYEGFSQWIGKGKQLVAAVVLGYANESPPMRGRKPLDSVVTWM